MRFSKVPVSRYPKRHFGFCPCFGVGYGYLPDTYTRYLAPVDLKNTRYPPDRGYPWVFIGYRFWPFSGPLS